MPIRIIKSVMLLSARLLSVRAAGRRPVLPLSRLSLGHRLMHSSTIGPTPASSEVVLTDSAEEQDSEADESTSLQPTLIEKTSPTTLEEMHLLDRLEHRMDKLDELAKMYIRLARQLENPDEQKSLQISQRAITEGSQMFLHKRQKE